MDILWQDVRFGLRMLVKNPGVSGVALLTLALSIGANTAIFSVLYSVLLRPLPYPQPEKLVVLYGRFAGIGLPDDENAISIPEFHDFQQHQRSFSALAAIAQSSYNLGVQGSPEQLTGAAVTPEFFAALGVQPRLGRAFLAEEATPGGAALAILGDGLWRRAFGADPGIIGKPIVINSVPTVIVGVMPPGFGYPDPSEIWTPLAFGPDALAPNNRGNHGFGVVARIKPELTLDQARADAGAITQAMIRENPQYPYEKFNFAVLLKPLLEDTVGREVQTSLWVLVVAVGFVLLIACANVAGLMLARAASRERETAIRLAMGAGRGRLLRQFLTESVLLALAGGLLGLAAMPGVLGALVRVSATALPRAVDTRLNWPMLGFTTLISLGTGIAFGLLPALRAARGVRYVALKEGGRGHTGAERQRSLRLLVAAEAAVSLVLLVGAGLLLRSFLHVLSVDPGFDPNRVLTLQVNLPAAKYPGPDQWRTFFRDAIARIETLPGVVAAGGVSRLPLSGGGGSGTTTIDTEAVPAEQATPEVDWRPITPGYFQAMGVTLLAGRYFDARDDERGQPVAIVDDTLASLYWPNESAVGKRLHRGGNQSTAPWLTIVGVVRHVRYRTLEAPSRAELYWPVAQNPYPFLGIAIRSSTEPEGLAIAAQRAIQAVDPDQPVFRVRTMEQWVAESVGRRRLALVLLGLFAGVALLLAAAGIYATMSFSVTQRYQEMGVRMALGASRRDVLRLVVGRGMRLTLAGLVAGVAGSLLLTRLIRTMLFAVSPADPLALAGGLALLAAVAFVACYLPARRATRVDPAEVLRYE
ncbi:MAG TPA: ABC transporter permease [Candidatus Polarisedimenticolaceae bacterium]|nr:ABC transporter permease [Candidatus Polarisedimenticolaceae bacterium]